MLLTLMTYVCTCVYNHLYNVYIQTVVPSVTTYKQYILKYLAFLQEEKNSKTCFHILIMFITHFATSIFYLLCFTNTCDTSIHTCYTQSSTLCGRVHSETVDNASRAELPPVSICIVIADRWFYSGQTSTCRGSTSAATPGVLVGNPLASY